MNCEISLLTTSSPANRGLAIPIRELSITQKVNMAQVQSYSERLNQGVIENNDVLKFRQSYPQKFTELCKVHLSFLLDIPCDFLDDDDIDSQESDNQLSGQSKRGSGTLGKWFSQRYTTSSLQQPLPDEIVLNLIKLFEYLEEDSCLQTEGIFRKSGNLTRQRELKERLLSGQDIVPLMLSQTAPLYSVHDAAGCVKSLLSDLKQPLLTSRFLGLFAQVASLSLPKLDDNGCAVPLQEVDHLIIEGKQIKALRILILLLPCTNRYLLRHLLKLLNRVSEQVENRMSSESLGTLFGPLLLTQKKTSSKELKTSYLVLNQLATFMVNHGEDLFLLPKTLADDISKNLHKLTNNKRISESRKSKSEISLHTCYSNDLTHYNKVSDDMNNNKTSSHDQDEDDSLDTCITFVERYSSSQYLLPFHPCPSPNHTSGLPDISIGETEFAVAELYARVQALPESTQKRRLVAKFNQVNGGGLTQMASSANGSFVRGVTSSGAFSHHGIRSSLRKRLAIRSQTQMPSHQHNQSLKTPAGVFTEKSYTSLREALSRTPVLPSQLSCIRDTSTSHSPVKRKSATPLSNSSSSSQDSTSTHPFLLDNESVSPPTSPTCSPFKKRWRPRFLASVNNSVGPQTPFRSHISSPRTLQFTDSASQSLSPSCSIRDNQIRSHCTPKVSKSRQLTASNCIQNTMSPAINVA